MYQRASAVQQQRKQRNRGSIRCLHFARDGTSARDDASSTGGVQGVYLPLPHFPSLSLTKSLCRRFSFTRTMRAHMSTSSLPKYQPGIYNVSVILVSHHSATASPSPIPTCPSLTPDKSSNISCVASSPWRQPCRLRRGGKISFDPTNPCGGLQRGGMPITRRMNMAISGDPWSSGP